RFGLEDSQLNQLRFRTKSASYENYRERGLHQEKLFNLQKVMDLAASSCRARAVTHLTIIGDSDLVMRAMCSGRAPRNHRLSEYYRLAQHLRSSAGGRTISDPSTGWLTGWLTGPSIIASRSKSQLNTLSPRTSFAISRWICGAQLHGSKL
ncbi:TPA: hypothetical protein N0F65_009451, partial [Lagenidium giganteum]